MVDGDLAPVTAPTNGSASSGPQPRGSSEKVCSTGGYCSSTLHRFEVPEGEIKVSYPKQLSEESAAQVKSFLRLALRSFESSLKATDDPPA